MVDDTTGRFGPLATARATAFTIAGVVFAANALVLLWNVVQGTEQYMTLGQGLIGTAWTAGFLGLLGCYPALADRNRWVARGGAVFAVVGLLTMLVMAVVSFGLSGGVLGGALMDYTPYFLPGVFLGIVLGFGSYGVAGLLTGALPRPVGPLFLLLVATFLFNLGSGIAGFNPLVKVLGVVAVLTVSMLAVGHVFRTGDAGAGPAGAAAPGP
jgi:hypothetical protein